jgi:hypothetical protein
MGRPAGPAAYTLPRLVLTWAAPGRWAGYAPAWGDGGRLLLGRCVPSALAWRARSMEIDRWAALPARLARSRGRRERLARHARRSLGKLPAGPTQWKRIDLIDA